MDSNVSPYANNNLTFVLPGYGPVNITFADIDDYAQYGIRISINWSSGLGASALLFVVLLLATSKEKRYTAIFALNAVSLLLNTIRCALNCVYYTGPFYEAYAYFSQDFSYVPRASYRDSIGADILTLLVQICLETSLFLQVKAVCATMSPRGRNITLLATAAVALVALAFRLTLTIMDSAAIWALNNFVHYQWLSAVNNYLLTASICVFSFIFDVKLAYAIYQRRKLGLRQFGPMQAIFIVGCQTLLIPAVFAILQNFTNVPELGSQVITVTVLFLPLSSLWAAASTQQASPNATSFPRKISNGFGILKSLRSGSSSKGSSRKFSNGSNPRSPAARRSHAFGEHLNMEGDSFRIPFDKMVDSHDDLV